MSVSGVSSAFPASSTLNLGAPKAKTAGMDAETQFMNYMKESPAEKMQDQWLMAHGLSREAFNAMSPEDKQKILQQMKQELEQKVKDKAAADAKRGTAAGVDILA